MAEAKKCPVCDWEIHDGGIKVPVGSKEVVACCEECAGKVREEPSKYGNAG